MVDGLTDIKPGGPSPKETAQQGVPELQDPQGCCQCGQQEFGGLVSLSSYPPSRELRCSGYRGPQQGVDLQ